MGVKVYNKVNIGQKVRFSKKIPAHAQEHLPSEPQYELPSWVSSGDLGTYGENEEIAITLEYYDPSNVVEGFALTGSLPSSVLFNDVGGTISGVVQDTTTTNYSFTVDILTIYGDVISEQFSIGTLITEPAIVWNTSSDLGTYDSGETLNQEIDASVEDMTV